MPTPTSLTFDLSPPRRPGIADLGGGQKTQRADAPPDPVTMLTAADVNQWALQLAALGAVCPVALLQIGYSAGAYFVSTVASPGDGILTTAFTATKVTTGEVTISWNPALLPTPVAPPQVTPLGGTPAMVSVAPASGSVTVHLANASGALDTGFSLALF